MHVHPAVRSVSLIAFLAVAGGCNMQNRTASPLSPSQTPSLPSVPAPATSAFATTWSSAGAAAPLSFEPGTCGQFQWTATATTAASVSGAITAVCMGMPIAGTGTAQLTGATTGTITVDATGQYNGTSCAIQVTADGVIEDRGETLRLSFAGTSCLGPFSGHETLYRKDLFPPAPAPAPEPPPPSPDPAPTAEPWEDCAAFVDDKPELVDCVHAIIQPGSSGERAFEVTKRVAWLLRHEGGGLLIKNGGENIISWQGYSFSISRICYPDGHIFKVITDAGDGGTNGSGWADNDYVSPTLYVPAIKP